MFSPSSDVTGEEGWGKRPGVQDHTWGSLLPTSRLCLGVGSPGHVHATTGTQKANGDWFKEFPRGVWSLVSGSQPTCVTPRTEGQWARSVCHTPFLLLFPPCWAASIGLRLHIQGSGARVSLPHSILARPELGSLTLLLWSFVCFCVNSVFGVQPV